MVWLMRMKVERKMPSSERKRVGKVRGKLFTAFRAWRGDRGCVLLDSAVSRLGLQKS
jgi:hypothetical protein